MRKITPGLSLCIVLRIRTETHDADDSDDSNDDGGITAHTTTLYQTDRRDARARSADRPIDRRLAHPWF